MNYNASGFILHYEKYKAVSFLQFWCGKVPNLFFCSGSKCCAYWKSLVPWLRVRQIHRSVSLSLLPLSCSVLHYFSSSRVSWILGNISLYQSAYLPKQPPGPLRFPWPSGEMVNVEWHPLGHHKLFPGVDRGPVASLSPILLCTGQGRSQFPVENYFLAYRGDVSGKCPPSNWKEKEAFFFFFFIQAYFVPDIVQGRQQNSGK